MYHQDTHCTAYPASPALGCGCHGVEVIDGRYHVVCNVYVCMFYGSLMLAVSYYVGIMGHCVLT